jgi:hypothetical protein
MTRKRLIFCCPDSRSNANRIFLPINSHNCERKELRKVDIIATMTNKRPDYRPLAESLLGWILQQAEDPQVMAEYEEWKKAREAQKKGA